MEQYEYFVLLAGCFCLVAIAASYFGVWRNVWIERRVFGLAIGITFLFFCVWDFIAILREHWWFNARYVTGYRALNIPVEELGFFVVIPTACLLTWQIIGKVLDKKK